MDTCTERLHSLACMNTYCRCNHEQGRYIKDTPTLIPPQNPPQHKSPTTHCPSSHATLPSHPPRLLPLSLYNPLLPQPLPQNNPLPNQPPSPTSLPRNILFQKLHHPTQPPSKLYTHCPRSPHDNPSNPRRSQMRLQARRQSQPPIRRS